MSLTAGSAGLPTRGSAGSRVRGSGGGGAAETGQGFGQDGLTVGVAAAFLHVGEVGLVRLNARRSRGVLLVLAGRVTAPGALPSLGYGSVGGETGPRLVPVGAPERHPNPGRGLAALGLSHGSRADPAAANGVATTHRSPLEGHRAIKPRTSVREDVRVQRLMSKLRATMSTNQRTPKKMVIRSRFRSTTEEEPRVEVTPPPNRSDSPPPLPLCSRTSRTITRLVMIRITESPMIISVIHLLPERPMLPAHDTGRSERTARHRGLRHRPGPRRRPAVP